MKSTEQFEDTEKELLKAEYEKLKDDCIKAQHENRDLKK